jgi:hypothetical protein
VEVKLEYVCQQSESSDSESDRDSDSEGEVDEPGVVVCIKRLRPPLFPVGNPLSASTRAGPTVDATTTGEAVVIATFTNDREADLPTVIFGPHGLTTVSVHTDEGSGLRTEVPGRIVALVALSIVCVVFCLL